MHASLIGRAALALAALVLAGCANTRITNAWQDPQWKSTPYASVLVVGVSQEPGIRRTYESTFTDRLSRAGVKATPSYTLIAEDGRVAEERIRQAVTQSGADAILMTRLVRTERRASVSPGYMMGWPGVGYWGGWPGYYSAAWAFPPTIDQYDVVTLETNLWDARTNRLVWSGTTETSDPASVNRVASDLADLVLREMGERGVLPVPVAKK